MFSLMIQKLLHKKWMVLCILIGNILLIAIAVSHPMYRSSSFQRMLTDEFDKYWNENGTWPAGFHTRQTTLKGISSGLQETEAAFEQAVDTMGIPVKEYMTWYSMKTQRAEAEVVRDGNISRNVLLAAASNLEEHVELLYGKFPEQQITKDGFLEVMVTEEALVKQDLLLNEVYKCDTLKDTAGNYIFIRIAGVFAPKDVTEGYWVISDYDLNTQMFANFTVYEEHFVNVDKTLITSMSADWHVQWEYEQISAEELSKHYKTYSKLASQGALKDKTEAEAFKSVISEYSSKAKQVEATLAILQIPILLLLCAFLYMISGQMLQMEQNEISLMKSRGATKIQIVFLYFLQSSFLALIAVGIGIPLGWGVCRVLGSATGFLEFSARRTLEIKITTDIVLYAVAAILMAIAMTTLPVIKYSGISIVKLKQKKAKAKKALWKKLYLDVVFIAIASYGYYSFRKNEQAMTESVLLGEAMDPLLYISFSLFILGCGLLICRLQPMIMKTLFRLMGKRLKPAAYASFLETIRSGYKQEFIILFMILTVAIGISNTTLSQTILSNMTSNLRYLTGSNVVLQEEWKSTLAASLMGFGDLIYYEPEYGKFQTIPGVETTTKVYRGLTQSAGEKISVPVDLMAIQVKGFAEVTQMEEGLLPYSYYDYINVLASDREGFLVSENFMNAGYQLGDTFRVKNNEGSEVSGKIRGFFNYWPGYSPRSYYTKEDGTLGIQENYMAVGNFIAVQNALDLRPYQVWMKVNDDAQGVYDWMAANPGYKFQKVLDFNQILALQKEDTLIQGTNGILSMSFIVVLVLCCVGYLIYWIMSIRSRELLFGILRAMGMRKKEITWMLVVEQICSGLYAVVAGLGVGILSSWMFIPMIQKAYAAADQMLPLELCMQLKNLTELFVVIIIMLCVCLFILGRIVSKMNISNALKLGED